MFNFLKENPYVLIAGFMASVATAVIAIDARYAHAGDVSELKQQLIVNDLRSDIRSLKSRKLILEDKIIEQTQGSRGTMKDSDKVLYERNKNELSDINEELRRKNDTVQKLETQAIKK